MNNPNPFVPQGSLVEQMNKKRARVKMAVLAIFSGTIVLIAPLLLIQGCKRDQSADNSQSSDSTTATADTNTITPTTADTAVNDTTNASSNNMASATSPMTPAPTATAMMAPAANPAPAPAAAATTTYVVVPHDTLAGIAKKYSVKLKELEAANPTVVPTKLKVGATLNIPASGSSSEMASATSSTTASTTDSSGEDVYTVKPGDSLIKIAHSCGTNYKAIMALNNLTTTKINAGQKLKLPAKTTAASPMESVPAAATTTTASNPTSGASEMH
jgi:LysM repeat protein